MRAVYGALLTLTVLSLSTDAQNNNTRCVVDIALVIDMSGSIMDTHAGNWARQMAFVKQLIRSLRVGKDLTRVGAVTFGNAAQLHFTLDQYNTKQEYLDAVDRIRYYGGNTNTTGGLLVARDQILSEKGGDRTDITDLILLITDGNPTRMVDELPRVAASIRDRGVRIIGVGVTDQVNQKLFRTIVTSPFAENYFNVTDFSSLMDILDAVIFASCRVIPPTPAPAPTAAPAGVCDSVVDLVVVLDVSGSVGEVNFAKLKLFISGLIRELDVESGRVRIGLSTFSDVVRNHFHLETFKARLDMVAVVEKIPYTRGSTNTAAAIRYARDIMLSTARGGRGAAARSVVVMVTDGASNDKEQTLRQAFLSKAAHVLTVVVALGGWTDMEELIGMASHPYRKNLFTVTGADALHDITHSLRDIICNNVNECLANPCLRGGMCVDGVGSYTCLCTSGIAGANCERRCRMGSDVVFAMDGSGSVGQLNFQKQIDFVKSVLMGFNLHTDTRVAVMTFSDNAKVKFYLNNFTSVSDVMEAMSFYYEGGTTNMAGALSVMRDEVFVTAAGDRPATPNIGVVFTDGRSDEEMATWRAAMEAREAGVHLMVLGVGVKVNEREVKGIASEPVDANTFSAASFSEMDAVRTRLLDAICNEVNDCEPDPCLNGGRCLDLLGGYRCECITGYSGVKCQRACDGMLDIVFAIDASGSIRRERFPYILRFVEQLVEQLEVREGRTRIGALTWSDTTQVQFQLNRYSSRQDVLHHLRHIQFTGGRTNTSSALRRVKDEMFTAANGARQDAQNILVMVTDGNSNVDPHTTIPDAIDARSKGVHITVVAVGTQLNELELRGIASSPERQNVYTVRSYRKLNTILPSMDSAVCNALDECASSPCANGGQCVDGFRKYTCMCRPDWTGETCTRQCRRQMDVVFLLDLSGSTDDVYDLCIMLTRFVIAGLPIRFDRARVGLVSFADKATTNFYLDTYTTKEEILNAISFRTAGGKTNTQGAIQMATDHVFTASRGDRAGVGDVMVLITDGHSNVRREETESTAARAMAGGIELFVVAVGPSPDMAQVHSIASDPDSEHVQRAAGHREVPAAAAGLLGQLCQN